MPYYLAARFRLKEEPLSQKVYTQAQEVIRTTDCDLSTYCFLAQQELTQPRPWYVVTIGETPPDEIHQKMTTILSQGEMTTLPQRAIDELLERRAEEIQKGSWREHHYTYNVQRTNPNKEKLKRQQQKQSRRRNRGT